MRLQQNNILDLIEEVKGLKIQIAEKDKRLSYLENRIAELEQYTRINVIITELSVKPWSYAQTVSGDSMGGTAGNAELDPVSTKQQVAAFLRSKGIALDSRDIEACHPLPEWYSSGEMYAAFDTSDRSTVPWNIVRPWIFLHFIILRYNKLHHILQYQYFM